MKKTYLLLLAIGLIAYGCNNREQSLEADVEIPVSVEDIKLKSIEEFITTTGTVIPVVDVKLNSEIVASYYLENNPATGRPWQLGDRVKKGAIIARFEDPEFVNNVKLEVHELNLELTKSEMEKQESLYEKGGVTLSNMKTAGYNYMNAQYTVENARLQMEKTKIVSPFDGVITDLPFYTQGSEIVSGSLIVQIMDYAKMILDVNLPEKYIETIRVGQEVRITNYTLPDDTLRGNITQLSPAINPDTRTFKGNITIKNPDLLLRPGMFVKSDIVTARKDSAIVIPKNIILSRQRGMTVFIVDRGVANERIIYTGLSNSDQVEVIRGLQVNERVIIDGFETLGQNTKVKIVK